MTHPEKPDVVERFLAGESELSRLYKDAPQEQPTTQFEQTILAAARDAAAQRAHTKVSGWHRFLQALDRARIPVATAASIVLVVGIAVGVYRQHGLNVPADFDAPPPAAPAAAAPENVEQRVDARANRRPAAPTVLIEKNGQKAPGLSKAEAPADQGADPAMRKETKNKLSKDLAPAPAGASVEEVATPLRSKVAPPASVAQEKALPAAEPALKPSEAPQAPKAPKAPKANQDTRSTVGEALPATPLPEAWLLQIENLLEQKNLVAARRELKAFKQAYPAYVLPEQLKNIESQ